MACDLVEALCFILEALALKQILEASRCMQQRLSNMSRQVHTRRQRPASIAPSTKWQRQQAPSPKWQPTTRVGHCSPDDHKSRSSCDRSRGRAKRRHRSRGRAPSGGTVSASHASSHDTTETTEAKGLRPSRHHRSHRGGVSSPESLCRDRKAEKEEKERHKLRSASSAVAEQAVNQENPAAAQGSEVGLPEVTPRGI